MDNYVILLVQYKKDLISTALPDCFHKSQETFKGKPLGKSTIRKFFRNFQAAYCES